MIVTSILGMLYVWSDHSSAPELAGHFRKAESMQVAICGPENQIVCLEKFVITLFLDKPDAGNGFFFAEVCSSATDMFHLVIPKGIQPCSQSALYLDRQSCYRLFSGYRLINESTGEHFQRVGETILHVKPVNCNITEVAPPREFPGYAAYHIGFDEPPTEDSFRGSWLFWQQPIRTKAQTDIIIPLDFNLSLQRITISNFYFFIVLPLNYRSQSAICQISKCQATMDCSPLTNPVHEFELDQDFSVFPAWRTWIYGRKILRNRDPLSIGNGEQISVFIKAVSDVVAGRLTTLSYFVGIGLALSASVLANSLFCVQEHGLQLCLVVETVVSFTATVVLGLLGWKVLKK